jgi:hypothetical protein
MRPSAVMVLALVLPTPVAGAPTPGPVIVSTPPAPTAPPTEPEVWVDLADVPEGVTTGDPEFIETDAPDGGVAEASSPRLPAVPEAPPTRVRRPQSPSPAPPEALARDLDPAITSLGCLAWSAPTSTAACIEGAVTPATGGRAVLTLLGQTDEPYELWTVRPAATGGETVPGDPVEVDEARARLSALDAWPLGAPVGLDAPGRAFLTDAAPAWLVWQGRSTRAGERHAVFLSCGARRARLFGAETSGGRPSLRAWTLAAGRFVLADFRTENVPEAGARSARAVLVDLHRLCRRGDFARP